MCEMFVDVLIGKYTVYGIILGKLQSVFIVFESLEIAHHTHIETTTYLLTVY